MKWNLWHNYKNAFKYDVTKKAIVDRTQACVHFSFTPPPMNLQLLFYIYIIVLFSRDTRDLK